MDDANLEDFVFLEKIGVGTFSTVYKVRHRATKKIYAIKQIELATVDDLNLIEREIEITTTIKHPFIAEIYKVVTAQNRLCLIMEYVENGTLLEYINNRGTINENEAKRIFIQILDALLFLHNAANVVHRDLKCENIMFDADYDVRVVDFGFSRRMDANSQCMNTFCGSAQYAAPEILLRQPYTKTIDIWSLGIILYGMVHGTLPFVSTNQIALINQITTIEPGFSRKISGQLRGLIQSMLDKVPERRITLEEILKHPWVSQSFGPVISSSPSYSKKEKVINISPSRDERIMVGDQESKSSTMQHINVNSLSPPKKVVSACFSTNQRMFSLVNAKIGALVRTRPIQPIVGSARRGTQEYQNSLPPL